MNDADLLRRADEFVAGKASDWTPAIQEAVAIIRALSSRPPASDEADARRAKPVAWANAGDLAEMCESEELQSILVYKKQRKGTVPLYTPQEQCKHFFDEGESVCEHCGASREHP